MYTYISLGVLASSLFTITLTDTSSISCPSYMVARWLDCNVKGNGDNSSALSLDNTSYNYISLCPAEKLRPYNPELTTPTSQRQGHSFVQGHSTAPTGEQAPTPDPTRVLWVKG